MIALGGRPRISSPASRTLPEARTSPVIALQSVVLPIPFRPDHGGDAMLEAERDLLERVGAAVVDVELLDGQDRGRAAGAAAGGQNQAHQRRPPPM